MSRLDVYFQNMTSFMLFHEPTFSQKLQQIPSFTQLNALLASMFAFASLFVPPEETSWQRFPQSSLNGGTQKDHHKHFKSLASKFIQEALEECGDETPTLCLLQALIISTHQDLARGVQGKAWRSLG
jgi:hypothetical protein